MRPRRREGAGRDGARERSGSSPSAWGSRSPARSRRSRSICGSSRPCGPATVRRCAPCWRAESTSNAPQPDGATPLHWAAYHDDLETAALLLEAGASAEVASTTLGVTPLYLACENGNAALVRALLAAGADARAALPSGETALMTAARTGSADAVAALVAHGADVNARESLEGQTALMWAVAQRHAGVVAVLIGAGADVQARSRVRPAVISRSARTGRAGAVSTRRRGRVHTAPVRRPLRGRQLGPGNCWPRGPIPTTRRREARARSSWPPTAAMARWPACCWRPAPTRTRPGQGMRRCTPPSSGATPSW